jgi:Ankyrin repeats (many copies)
MSGLSTDSTKLDDANPVSLLRSIFEMQPDGLVSGSAIETRSVQKRPVEKIDNYTMTAVRAIRDNDVTALRNLIEEKGPSTLDACNRNGETLLHLACRRGNIDTVDFLLNEAAVPLAVVQQETRAAPFLSVEMLTDDLGRSPLHDVCWRPEASPEILRMVLSKCPSPFALLQQDHWGHTPMDYVRQEHWPIWNDFLRQHEFQLKRQIEITKKFQ